MKKVDWPIILILIAYVALAFACSLVVPPFEGLDEIEHFGVTRYVAETGQLPVQGDSALEAYHARQEASQPPLYYLVAALTFVSNRARIAPSEVPLFAALAQPELDLPISFENGLTLLGYCLDRTALKPGETAHLETIWHVDSVPDRLLSIMAHVLAPDGRAFTVGDGLGVPIESWQPGDVIVQRHTLTLPKDTPRGTYWLQTGIYWIDGGQRWPARDHRATGDHAILAALQVSQK